MIKRLKRLNHHSQYSFCVTDVIGVLLILIKLGYEQRTYVLTVMLITMNHIAFPSCQTNHSQHKFIDTPWIWTNYSGIGSPVYIVIFCKSALRRFFNLSFFPRLDVPNTYVLDPLQVTAVRPHFLHFSSSKMVWSAYALLHDYIFTPLLIHIYAVMNTNLLGKTLRCYFIGSSSNNSIRSSSGCCYNSICNKWCIQKGMEYGMWWRYEHDSV